MSEQRQTPLSNNTPSLRGGGSLKNERTLNRQGSQIRRQQTQPVVTFAPDQYAKDRKAALKRVRNASPNTRLKDMLCTVTELQQALKKMPQKASCNSGLNFGTQQVKPLMQIQKYAREYLNDYNQLAVDCQFSQSSNLGSSYEALQIKRRVQQNRHCLQEQSEEEKIAVCRVKLNNQSENESIKSRSRLTNNEMQGSNKSRSSQLSNKDFSQRKRSIKEGQPHPKNGLVVFPDHRTPLNKEFEAETTQSLARNKSEKIQVKDQLDEESTSQNPMNLDYLTQKQKEDLAAWLLSDLGNIAQGNFDLGLSSLAHPLIQQEVFLQIDHKDQIHVQTPTAEDLGNFSNVTDPIDLVSPIPNISSRKGTNPTTHRVSNCTSYEEFYEFEKMQKGDEASAEEREYGEEEMESSESEEHHEDTQFDEITSACRFLEIIQKQKRTPKVSRKTVNKQIKHSVQSTRSQNVISIAPQPTLFENEEVDQSAYDVGGGGILHSSNTKLEESPKRSYVMVPRQPKMYPISTDEKIKQAQEEMCDAKGKAGIADLAASWREQEKFVDQNFTFQTSVYNKKKVASLSPVHSRGSIKSGRMQSVDSQESKNSPAPEIKKVVFSQLSDVKSETHENENQQNQTNQESFIESQNRQEFLETSEKSVKIINDPLIVREMNEDQITGNDVENSTNLYQNSQMKEKHLAFIPNDISPLHYGTLTPQSAVVKQTPDKDNSDENFGNKESYQKKPRPQSGVLRSNEFKPPPTEEETSSKILINRREAQSTKEGSNPYRNAPQQFNASFLQPAPKSILITSKSRQFQKQGSQKHSSFADQQNEEELSETQKKEFMVQDVSQDQTEPTEMNVCQQPKIIVGSNRAVDYNYQEVASLQNPDTMIHTASNSALISAMNSKKVSKDQLEEKSQKPERARSDLEYKCVLTPSHHQSGYIKQEDQAEESFYAPETTAQHFPSNNSPVNKQLSNNESQGLQNIIPSTFEAPYNINVLSEGDTDIIPEPSQIMDNFPRIAKTPAFEEQEFHKSLNDKTDIWHGSSTKNNRNQGTQHMSNKDMKGHTNRTHDEEGEILASSGPLHESHADMKTKMDRGVTFHDKSMQMTQDRSSTDLVASEIANEKDAHVGSTGTISQDIVKIFDKPVWSIPPPITSLMEQGLKTDENPDSEQHKDEVFSNESRSDEKVREDFRQEAALHKDHKELKLKSLAQLRVELQDFVEQNYEPVVQMTAKSSIQQSKEEILAAKDIQELTRRIRKYWDSQEGQPLWSTEERGDLQGALEEHRRVTKGFSSYVVPMCVTPGRNKSRQEEMSQRGNNSAQFLRLYNPQEVPTRSVKNVDKRNRYYCDSDPQNLPVRQRRLRSSNTIRDNSNIMPQYQIGPFDGRRKISQAQNQIASMQYPSQIDSLNAVKRRNIKSGANLASQYGRMNQQPDDHILAVSNNQQQYPFQDFTGTDASSSQGSCERTIPRANVYKGQLISVTPPPYEAELGRPKPQRQLAWATNKVGRHQTPDFNPARSTPNAQQRRNTQCQVIAENESQQDEYQMGSMQQGKGQSSFSAQYRQFKEKTFCQGHLTTQNSSSVTRTRVDNLRTTDQSLLMYSRVQNMGVDIDTLPRPKMGTISIQASHARIFNKTKGQNCLVKKKLSGPGQIHPVMGRRRTRQVQLFI